MKVLVVGGGGREHALAWKVAASPAVTELHAAPGNAGIAELGICHAVSATDIGGQVALARRVGADLVLVGPDDPLALGLVDALQAAGIAAFGPTKAAAQLEWSKAFAKQVMTQAGVPTAACRTFNDYAAAMEFVRGHGAPVVVKADGLAAGKGVIIARSEVEASDALREIMLSRAFGEAGSRVLIEDFLEGPEVSVLAFSDGKTVRLMPPVQDHKRIGEGDTGLNTGGMGTYTPVPGYTPEVAAFVQARVVQPVIDAMHRRGTPFKGCLFTGLMLTSGGPMVLEFNARFGDPETQVLMPLLETDLVQVLRACIDGTLGSLAVQWRREACACVVMASQGYPERYEKGKVITGFDLARQRGALLFHAGTARQGDDVVTAGGRVIGVVGTGPDLKHALATAYWGVEAVQFAGRYARRDIGWRALRG